ncbi:DUF397 domain-containing protein [Streptodolium elevatio]|uniref:DUF397 domain-containing protein n=1 Tax=Streptodolium elevatio TaxID=3157996 RepID=A0ABV3D8V0_9ACTN
MNVSGLYEIELDDVTWRKSSYTANNDQCVEIADVPTSPAVAVRDSKNPHIPAARVSSTAWSSFVQAAKQGSLRPA